MLNVKKAKEHLSNFTFKKLFIEVLGWSNPKNTQENIITLNKVGSLLKINIAELSGVAVYEIRSENGLIPNAEDRKEIHKEISKLSFENLLIFLDKEETQSLWYWIKREDKKSYVRDHLYIKGQPGDLFLNKLSGMVVDLGDFDSSGNISVLEVANRLKKSLDIEKVTKKFYNEFKDEKSNFIEYIKGIKEERDKHWYASITLNRLMFVYFLQKKGFVDKGRVNYLKEKLEESKKEGKDLFYKKFLEYLFFEGFAKEKKDRSKEANAILGEIKYLNGGLFLKHRIEKENEIKIVDKAFETLFTLFEKYSWHLDDSPGGKDDEINPAVLGYIFEKYINQKEFGAYYTRTEMTDYLAERTIHKALLQKIKEKNPNLKIESISEVLLKLDDTLVLQLLNEILPQFSVIDPACGSGAFLVAAMKILIDIYSAIVGKAKFSKNKKLNEWLKVIEQSHPSFLYFIKKRIITDNLYGVDIMEEAVEIARLRLFLSLASSANSLDELEPLPNIDFNVLAGNSLIGLIKVDENKFDKVFIGKHSKKVEIQMGLPGLDKKAQSYHDILKVKSDLIAKYKEAAFRNMEVLVHSYDTEIFKEEVEEVNKNAQLKLNQILLEEFQNLKIQYEEATWDEQKKTEGKTKKRPLTIVDIETLRPFHWGYMFDEIIARGGFDCILTNPPWEIFKPNAKEFFLEYSELVTRKRMDIKSFEKEKGKLLQDKDLRHAWLVYLNAFPHVSLFYRNSTNYKNQISIVNDKKAGTDINLYKLFTEQCFNLLKPNGDCGIVIPSGIYTDLGTKQLREMLFSRTNITGLFCFENKKEIFENVHRSFKFVVLTFEKVGLFPSQSSFPSPPSPLPGGEGGMGRNELAGRGRRLSKDTLEFARELRQRSTKAEEFFWEIVRDSRLNGLKFRRQHSIGNYIADFYCHEYSLVIELDGPIHDSQKEKDKQRDKWFSENKFTVIRFTNEEIFSDTEHCLEKILQTTYHPSPSGRGKEGEGNKPLSISMKSFPAAFMRHDVKELDSFPNPDSIRIDIDLVRKLSPDSLSIMEFKTEMDIVIAKKMLRYPLLGEEIKDSWNLKLGNEFHMTNDSHLFKTKPAEGRLPLYEGKMIWQFDSHYAEPKYWLSEKEGRKELINSRIRKINLLIENNSRKIKFSEKEIELDFQNYRIGFRDISASTNERAMASSIIPKNAFCGNTLNLQLVMFDKIEDNQWIQYQKIGNAISLFLVSLFNSFVLDSLIRKKITSHLNMFYIYQLPVPRLSEKSTGTEKITFDSLVERAAKLICTTEEFAELWEEVIGTKWTENSGITDDKARMKLRAEIDAIVAHLYGITEVEFIHILSTFPIVKEEVKQLTLEEFRKG